MYRVHEERLTISIVIFRGDGTVTTTVHAPAGRGAGFFLLSAYP
jgi:hypothetical protein